MPIEILAAEDEETDLFFLQQALAQSEIKNNLHVAQDGQGVMEYLNKALKCKDTPLPHIILLDINMPRKNGHETLAEIKAHDKLCHIPVVMFSGSKAMEDVHRSYANHACAYVPKAKSFQDMMRVIASMESFWFRSAILPQGH